MPMELRKRKAPVAPPVTTKKTTKTAAKQSEKTSVANGGQDVETEPAKSGVATVVDAVKGKTQDIVDKVTAKIEGTDEEIPTVAVGTRVALEGFGGVVETQDGEKTTLKQLLEKSENGVVLFTYPKASTPGCTNQVCFFRDAFDSIKDKGYAVYGMSTDSPKANTNFQQKQKLPYPLLCDPEATLIGAIGLKKPPKKTVRGVFVVSKDGEVQLAEPGSPAGTLEAVKKLLGLI